MQPGLSVATSGMKADPDYVYHDPEPSELAAALWSEVERRAEEKYKARQLLPAPKSTSTSTEDAMDMPELASLRELVESMSRGEF